MAESTTRFLSNEELWRELHARVVTGKRVRAAVAYFGRNGAELLPLKKGDSIVLDMSIGSVRQGVTNPRAVRTLMKRGVRVFSRASLHAKFLVSDRMLIASSANASTNSKEILDEAGIVTTDPASVQRAISFFDRLCTERVGREYLKKCISEYRPPTFTPAIECGRPRTKRSGRVVEAKLWFVGGLVPLNLSEKTRESVERVERRYKKRLTRSDETEVTWIRFRRRPGFLQHVRIGDWIVDCSKTGHRRFVGPPMQMLGLDEWVSERGTRYTMMMLETPTEGEGMSLRDFRRKICAVQPELDRGNPRTRAIEDNDHADSILRLWTVSGKIVKSRRA